ncbi:MAG: hypothetical protein HY781_02355 [Chloroflexi bacterium]|nr:hypothetical protein [Chloroflexota bacterium]
MITRRRLLPMLLLIFLAVSCNIPIPPGTAIGGITTLPPIPPGITNLSGTWNGTLTTGAFTFPISIVIEHSEDNSLTGNVTISDPFDPGYVENYVINGSFDGITLRMEESEGRFYTATYLGEALDGYVAWNCYDCPEDGWGIYTLTREGSLAIRTPLPPTVDVNGTWVGTLDEWSGASRLFDLTLIITQEAGSSEFTGSVQLTEPGTDYWQNYLIAGIIEGNTIRFHNVDSEEILYFYWGEVSGNTLSGNVSGYCYACDAAFGEFTVNR